MTYKIDKENTTQTEDNLNDLLKLIKNPLNLIRNGIKYGVVGVKQFFLVVGAFLLINIIGAIFTIVQFFSVEFSFTNIFLSVTIVFIGLIFLLISIFKMYSFAKMDLAKVIYSYSSPYFHKLCSSIIDKTSEIYKNNKDIKDTKIIAELLVLNDKKETLPFYYNLIISKILSKVPFAEILSEIKSEISSGNKEKASGILFDRMDNYIKNVFFAGNSIQWVYWLLPLNILLQLYLILKIN